MIRGVRRVVVFSLALFCTAQRPQSSPRPAALRELHFPQDVPTLEEHDSARIQAYATPSGVHFEITGPPEIAGGRITVRGQLVNDDPVPHDVIFFPAGAGGFDVHVVPSPSVTLRPPPPGAPMPPPPVPPPPQPLQIPARSRIVMSSEIFLASYSYAPGTHTQIEWEYDFQNPPRPSGRIDVVLP
jgi:hypothetical protein